MVNSSDSKASGGTFQVHPLGTAFAVYTTPLVAPVGHEEKRGNDGGHMEHRGTQANAQPPPTIDLRRHAQAHEPLAQRGAPASLP